jgi:hypothetical protein
MIYCSIDIETSGLDSENHQILSIGVIVEDTTEKLSFEDIPKFHCAIVDEEVRGGLFALNMNRDLIATINDWNASNEIGKKQIEEATGMVFCKRGEVVSHLFKFLYVNNVLDKSLYMFDAHTMVEIVNGKAYPSLRSNIAKSNITVAGKNFATFDKLFLEKLPRWQQVFKIRQRMFDPTVLYTDWTTDEEPPNLSKCKDRAGLGGSVAHNALEDAWDVITLMRKLY